MACKVSAVSPDWLTPMTRVRVVEDRVAVAELAGDVDLHRQAGPVLDGVLGHEAGVVAAATGHDEHLVEGPELVVGDVHLVEVEGAVGQQPVEQGVGHRLGLLVDLLAHEVVVAVLAGGVEVPVDGHPVRG